MKQKVLGAAIVCSAQFSSFAGASSGGDKAEKLDLSKLDDCSVLTNLKIKIKNVEVELNKLAVKDGQGDEKFTCNKDKFKEDSYSVTLTLLQPTTEEDDVVVYVGKISTDSDGKKLKLEAVADFKELAAGSYVIITVTDDKKCIKVEKKVFEKKQKVKEKNKGFEDAK
jgi:hypothetical protein